MHCKFSFPRRPTNRPVLNDLLTSIASHKSGSQRKKLYEIERQKCEERINDYNPALLSLWGGNVDIQFVGEDSEYLVEYICKYATKGPKSALDDVHIESLIDSSKSDYSQLMSLAMKLTKSREMGAIEAAYLLLAKQAYQTDTKFQPCFHINGSVC